MGVQAFKRGVSAYDFVAEIISHIKELNTKLFFNPESRLNVEGDDEEWIQAVEELVLSYPELTDTRELCTFGISPRTVTAIHSWEHYEEFFYVLTLLQRITRAMKCESIMDSSYVVIKNKTGFEALNDNTEETGVYLLPKVPSLPVDGRRQTNPKQWLSRFNCGINQELSNVCYFLKEDLEIGGQRYKVCNHICSNFLVEGATNLKIALSPLLRDAELELSYSTIPQNGEKKRLFSVTSTKNLPRVLKRSRTAFLKACKAKADIVLFPEMLGSAQLLTPDLNFSKTISEWIEEAGAKGYPAPHLIIGPSWWHDKLNELHVLSSTAQRIIVQYKHFPFFYTPKGESNPYLEDLQDSDHTVHLLHIPGLGRMAFPICVDFLHSKYMELLVQKLYCNLLMCPSYSPSKTLFVLNSLAQHPYGSWPFWINSCSAPCGNGKRLPEYVGAVAPIQADGKPKLQYLCVPDNCRCGEDDECCLFICDIDLQTGNISVDTDFPLH